jgi:hypothetical protein
VLKLFGVNKIPCIALIGFILEIVQIVFILVSYFGARYFSDASAKLEFRKTSFYYINEVEFFDVAFQFHYVFFIISNILFICIHSDHV